MEKAKRKYTEAHRRATVKYMTANVWQIGLKINRKLMPEIAEWLKGKENVQEYIKGLIQADLRRSKMSGSDYNASLWEKTVGESGVGETRLSAKYFSDEGIFEIMTTEADIEVEGAKLRGIRVCKVVYDEDDTEAVDYIETLYLNVWEI